MQNISVMQLERSLVIKALKLYSHCLIEYFYNCIQTYNQIGIYAEALEYKIVVHNFNIKKLLFAVLRTICFLSCF